MRCPLRDRKQTAVLSVLIIAPMLAVCGCGSRGDLEKVVVEGAITYDGKPVENGDILFRPETGAKGPISGAAIKDGRYTASGKGGVPVGNHTVSIRAYRGGGASAGSDLDAMGVTQQGGRIQYIPAKYNNETMLTITIDNSANPATHDFALEK